MSNYIEFENKIAFHPGYYIKEYIDTIGLTQEDFANRLGTTPKNISYLIRGEQSLSLEMALKLARMIGTSVKYWLNLQNEYDSLILEFEDKKELKEEPQNPKKIDRRLLACYGNIDVQQKALSTGQIGKARKCQKMLDEYLNELDNESYREMAVKYKREKFAELVMERVAIEKKKAEYMNYMKECFDSGTVNERKQADEKIDKLIKKMQVNLVDEKTNEKNTELELQIG